MSSGTDDVTITYPVERSLVERAVELLNRQRRVTGGFHKFLTWPGIVFAATLLALSVTALFYLGTDRASLIWFSAPLFGLHFLTGLVLLIAFLALLPQMGVQWWIFRGLRKIGLGEPALARPPTWRRRLRQIVGLFFAVVGVVFLMLAGPSLHLSFIPSDTEDSGLSGFIMSIVFLGLGLPLTVPHFISRRRQSLDLIRRTNELSKRLSQTLSETSAGVTVAVRAQDLNMMARMEQAHIEAEREEAVARARREERPDDLVLLKTKDAVTGIRKLEPETRILVQEQAAALTQAAESAGAKWNEESGLWELVVLDTQVQLNYAVDKEKHQVKLVSVVNLEEGGQTSGSGHAARQ